LGINRSYVREVSTASTLLGEGFTTPATYSGGKYFGFELGYDKAPTVGAATWNSAANYNGNITGMIWKSVHDGQIRKYDFSYDAVNRLTAANFTQYYNGSFNSNSGINYTANNLSYDANGNILSMNQYGLKTPVATSSSLIDQLSYTYLPGSNKLQRVTDAANDSSSVLGDFKYLQKNKTDTDYVYDTNGNLIADKNKNISNIAYNILNLPQTITVAGKGTITYTYDAAGNKLRKQTVEGSKTTTTLYGGNIVYENDTLQFISHEEGRTRINNNNYVFDYYLKDHLGNVRMTITDDNTASSPVIDATSYYPFGLVMSGVSIRGLGKLENKYKFVGREWQDELGLNMYDLRARQYDPAIARFVAVDPLTDEDEQLDKSNYAYAWNDPIKYNDPDGECPWCVGAILGAAVEIGSQAAANYVNGKDVTDISWGQVGVAAVEGALTSGASVGRTLAVKAGAALASSAIDYANDGNKISSVKDGLNIVKNAAINVAVDKVAGGVSKFALGKIGEKALTKAGDKAILSNNTANKIVKAVTGTSNRTANAIAKKVDVVGGSKVVSKAIKEAVSTAGTAAAKAAANKKVEDVKKSTSF
jgi:RHS repeat-associated protein